LSVVGVGMQQCMIRNQNEMHKLTAKSRMDANMQQTIDSFRPLFPRQFRVLVKSLTFWSSNSPTFPDKWSPWILYL